MTQYTLRTSREEAEHIMSGDKPFVFRENKYKYRKGDKVTFSVVRNGRPVIDPIDNEQFVISYVGTSEDAPIGKGWVVLGVRRMR